MKDFDKMTEKENEDLLIQILNLSDDVKGDSDSFDLFTPFNEISKTWSDSLKEFENLYPEYLKDEKTNPLEKYESNWTAKIRKKLFLISQSYPTINRYNTNLRKLYANIHSTNLKFALKPYYHMKLHPTPLMSCDLNLNLINGIFIKFLRNITLIS